MSAHAVELFWTLSCLFGKVVPLLVLLSDGSSARTAVWLEREVTDGTVAGLWPRRARGVLYLELMGPTSV